MLLRWGVQNYTFLTYGANIDFVVNKNANQVEFACPKLVNPLKSHPKDTDSESDSDWEEGDTHDDGNAFDVFKD